MTEDKKRDYLLDAPEEVLSTLMHDGKRRWLYPKWADGEWLKKRAVVGYLLICIYILVPFIRIGGKPLFLIDIIDGQLFLFGKMFFATDTAILLLFGLSVVISVMTITAYVGRAWCGWGCPQTVYLEFVFRPIERLIEGSSQVRKRRDDGPLTGDKLVRKLLKYAVYTVICFVLANTFIAYFVGTDRLLQWVLISPANHIRPFLVVVFVTGLMMFDFCYFREQMCTIACPYARFQSALLDRNSVIVTYDSARGEPRGRGRDRTGKGHCVDCNHCMEVCPTGIDIRKGLQLECIHCTQCIDACDSIMDKVGFPRGLIRYSSINAIQGETTHAMRPRTVLYTTILAGLVCGLFYMASSRAEVEFQFLRDRAAPYVVLSDGMISNVLNLKITNKSTFERNFSIRGIEPADASFVIPDSNPVVSSGSAKVSPIVVKFARPQNTALKIKARLEVAANEMTPKIVEFDLSYPK